MLMLIAVPVGLAMFAMIALALFAPFQLESGPTVEHSSEAVWDVCRKFVLERLHAPKTAEFARFSDSKIVSGDGEVHPRFDAQNGFGR